MKGVRKLSLIGDGIENAFNIEAMQHAAEMFNARCAFRHPAELIENVEPIETAEIASVYSHILALDNWKNSHVLYGYELPENSNAAIVVGNERRGISREVTDIATHALSIPMISKQLNCINVAAASAVALYYLWHAHRGRMQTRKDPEKRRPELLLIGSDNHAELGSAIRSSAAFGWNRAFVEDRSKVWFGCDRITRSEGRAAARRGRNQIRLIPCLDNHRYLFREAVIVTTKELGTKLHRVDLNKGANQVVVVPDETRFDVETEDWSRVAEQHSFAQIEVPSPSFKYHFRHMASIALAETSRQVGQRAAGKPARQGPLYEHSMKLYAEAHGEEVALEDLLDY